ncbi:zinc ribbon domain-containing protein [Burkholderia cenocepacia]|nr:zinc ribbon domain-containing protein [Burkholderia cenocepacia]
MSRIVEAPYVAPDIGPYQAVAVDVATGRPPVINSRSAHREFLKRNGYVEVGNESVGRKAGEVRGDFNLRSELTSATREVLGKTR